MARPLRIEYPGAFYHVMARGNEKKPIFYKSRDRQMFLDWLERAREKFGFWVHAYALLENHYHLYMETPQPNLSRILHYLNSGYTQWFNRVYTRVGHLFQGRYKALLVDRDAYSLELTRYIHLNPVTAGLCSAPESFPWSSYPAYLGLVRKPPFLRTDWILDQFGDSQIHALRAFETFTWEGLQRKKQPLEPPIWAEAVIGSSPFIQWVKDTYLTSRQTDKPDPDLPLLKKAKNRATPEEIQAQLGQDKKLLAYFLRTLTSLKLREIAKYLGNCHLSNVTCIARRVKEKMTTDPDYARMVAEIQARLLTKSSNVKA
jgi:REP element-mobilizing transposase RayT